MLGFAAPVWRGMAWRVAFRSGSVTADIFCDFLHLSFES